MLHNKNVLLCAVTAAFGGLTFGYDQGMISVTLVMQPFLQVNYLHTLALHCLTLLLDRARDRRRIPPRGLQQGLAHCDPRARGYDRCVYPIVPFLRHSLTSFTGAAQTGFIADRFSRKRALTLGALWFIVGSIIQTATYSYAQLVVGRFLGGVGIGLLSCTHLPSHHPLFNTDAPL